MVDRRAFLTIAAAGAVALACARPAFAENLKVGLLTQGSATESGWNLIAYRALQQVGKELGAEISNVEVDDNPASYEKAFRDYASRGFDVMIGHGFQFEDAARDVAPDFPDAHFIITSSNVFEDNLIGVRLNVHQPFFLIGALAALRSEKAGFIGGVEVPPIKEALVGFRNGAHYVKPDFEVMQVMTGSWSDLATAKEAALSMLASGATMIVPNANVAGLGVFQAVAEKGPDFASFGTFGNYTDKAPKNILGNFDPDFGLGLVKVVAKIKDGEFNPTGSIVFGVEEPQIQRMVYNPDAAHPVTDEEKAKLDAIIAKLVSGEIDPAKE
jgi:simple sugar transport system substrate-binding protein